MQGLRLLVPGCPDWEHVVGRGVEKDAGSNPRSGEGDFECKYNVPGILPLAMNKPGSTIQFCLLEDFLMVTKTEVENTQKHGS